jgi:hypothetical protein
MVCVTVAYINIFVKKLAIALNEQIRLLLL